MTVKKILNEIEGIVFRTTNLLLEYASETGAPASELRYQVGDLQARCNEYVRDATLGRHVLVCFKLATAAGITVQWMDKVLESLVNEQPTELLTALIVQNMILTALAQDGQILAKMEFTSRQDVEDMIVRMHDWFFVTRDLAAEQRDNLTYQALNFLAGATIRYLADVARPLPKMILFDVVPQPALALSNYLYGDGSHNEDLVAENEIIHPLFCPNRVRGLSVAPT